jgi:hypothetical protein
MAPDRNKMADLHEQFLAELTGGRRSRGSGSTWQDPADGRNNRLVTEFAFAVEGKSTTTGSITPTLGMLAKLREQAGGERPLLGLRWYATEDLEQVAEDWIAIPAADFDELLLAARAQAAAEAPTVATPVPGPPPAPLLHGGYPEGLPVPPPEMWPCFVINGAHSTEEPVRMVTTGYSIDGDGRVGTFPVTTVRIEKDIAAQDRLMVNDLVVRRGMLIIDGVVRTTVGAPR